MEDRVISDEALIELEYQYANICVAKNAYLHNCKSSETNVDYDKKLEKLEDYAADLNCQYTDEDRKAGPVKDIWGRLIEIDDAINKHVFIMSFNQSGVFYIDESSNKRAIEIIKSIIDDVNFDNSMMELDDWTDLES